MPLTSPTLWVVATPLGNPGDFTPRARRVLSAADIILAEDTRRAGLFFQRNDVTVQGCVWSFFEHNEQARIPSVLRVLSDGHSVALMSDAGTPLVGDPGYRLVRACRAAGHAVSPVPGASAPVAALSASGLPPSPFTFFGFLSRSSGEIRRLFNAWARMPSTLVFFERTSRLRGTLDLAYQMLGPRDICLARELTKDHEEFVVGRLENHALLQWETRGEMTVLIGPPESREPASERTVDAMLREAVHSGTHKEVARTVARQVEGWSAKQVYTRLIALHQDANHPGRA
jgi:16S rRNA (cytidine1402-2'-O)-methyltransferase